MFHQKVYNFCFPVGNLLFVPHVYRMLELGGEDVIACGSDFDGGITSQMDNPALFASFGDYMVDHGISRRVSDKIMFENALHFFEENIK